MRPHDPSARKQRAGVARARMFIQAHLGWLPGWPGGLTEAGLRWCPLPRPGAEPAVPLVLSRSLLHQATRTRTTLLHRFPHALPRVVADSEAWAAGISHILTHLKAAVHDGVPPPASLLSAYPRRDQLSAARLPDGLAPLRDALSWALLQQPVQLSAAVAWMSGEEARLQRILDQHGVAVAARLWALTRAEKPRRVENLMAWLSHPDSGVPLDAGRRVLRDWLAVLGRALGEQRFSLPELEPEARLRGDLGDFFGWLYHQDRATRRRALALLETVWPTALPGEWAGAWETVHPELVRTRRLLASRRSSRTEDLRRQRAVLSQHLAALPPPLRSRRVLYAIRGLSSNAAASRALSGVLAGFPVQAPGSLPRAALLLRYAPHRALPTFLSVMRALRRVAALPEPLVSFGDSISRWSKTRFDKTDGLDSWLLHGDPLPTAVAAALIWVSGRMGDEEPLSWEGLSVLARHTPEPLRLLALAREAAASLQSWPEEETVALAVAAEGDGLRMVEALAVLVGEGESLRAGAVSALLGCGGVVLARHLLSAQRRRQLSRLGALVGGLSELGIDLPEPRLLPGPLLLPDAPSDLHEPLRLLAGVCPDPAIARRLLRDDLPDPVRLREELARLTAIPDPPPHLARRIHNLTARLEAPRSLSPARLQRLAGRITAAARDRACQAWEAALQASLQAALAGALGVPPLPALLQPEWLPIVAAIQKLPERQLGLSLLRRRCGPPPWRPVEHPANQIFLAALRDGGVDPGPWLDSAPVQMVAESGEAVVLALEDDPLEIFRMGDWFNTCLSPGSINFFSVLANTADINKRVLVARTPAGAVAGRCLLALADGGGILTFHPYSHDSDLGMADLVRRRVLALAEAMGTHVVPAGTVRCLVARRWYDDGPVDLTGSFPSLSEPSFVEALQTIAPEALIDWLTARLDPLPLSALTLPPILSLPAILARPALVVALLPLCQQTPHLPDDVVVRIAEVAFKAGEHEPARRLLAPMVARALRGRSVFPHYRLLRALRDIDPAAAIRLTRRLMKRERDTPSWVREGHAYALAHLGRPRKAIAAWQVLLEQAPTGAYREMIAEQIASLEASIG